MTMNLETAVNTLRNHNNDWIAFAEAVTYLRSKGFDSPEINDFMNDKKEECTMKKYTIYTDGSCLGNPGRGGCAFVKLDENGTVVERQKYSNPELTTNNRMEFMAVLKALQSVEDGAVVTIVSDSQNVNLYDRLKSRGWRTSTGKPAANLDLLQQIDREVSSRSIQFSIEKCSGHADDKYNNMADNLAREASAVC